MERRRENLNTAERGFQPMAITIRSNEALAVRQVSDASRSKPHAIGPSETVPRAAIAA
jgi:hypothetical protein